MSTQTDGVLIGNWSNFAQDMLKLYAVNKVGNVQSVVPKEDSAVVSPSQTPQASITGINLKSPLLWGGVGAAVLVLFLLMRR